MVIPTKINPPQDPDEPQSAQSKSPNNKDTTAARSTAPSTDDGTRKPFKEVLESTMANKNLKTPSKTVFKQATDDDDDEVLSLLDLAASAQTKVREGKTKLSSSDTTVFYEKPPEVVSKYNLIADDSDTDVVDTDVNVDEDTTVIAEPVAKKSTIVAKDDVIAAADEDVVIDPKDKLAGKKPVLPTTVDPRATDALNAKKAHGHTDDVGIDAATKVASKDVKEHKIETSNVVVGSAPHLLHDLNVAVPVKAAETVSNVRAVLERLAQSMVDQIQQVTTPGKVETTVTLKYPPMFEGVQVKITEFNTSQKELNVTFGDVNNPTARALIAQTDNQVKLQQALLDRGYTVQMVIVEQKIPGLNSTQTGDVSLRQQARPDGGDAGSATDQDEGNVT